MITIRELTSDPAREIVEGRTRLRTVRTIPYVAPQSMPLKRGKLFKTDAECRAELAALLKKSHPACKYHNLDSYLESYRAVIDKRTFTARDLAIFFCNLGWQCGDPVSGASQKLCKLLRAGIVTKNGLEGAGRADGRNGAAYLYQFV